MSKYYLFDHAKTFFQGALGAMSFGIYYQYVSNQVMKCNDEKNDIRHKHDMEQLENKLEKLHRKEMDELKKEFQLQIQQLQ
jgi:hypothetical protein